MASVDIGGFTIGYDDIGRGPPLLCIQGLGFARWGWRHQIDDLARFFRVITVDNRGIGGSPDPAGPQSVAQLAGDMARFLDALGIDRAHVMGASAGGFVALELALTHPDRIDRLALVCTAGTGTWAVVGQPTIDIFTSLGLGPTPPDPSKPPPPLEDRAGLFTANMFSDAFGAAHPEALAQIIDLRAETAQPVEAWLAHFNANLAFDRRADLARVPHETLVIHGEEDRVVKPEAGAALAEALPNGRYELLPGGHVFFLEQPVAFNAAIIRFLRGDAS